MLKEMLWFDRNKDMMKVIIYLRRLYGKLFKRKFTCWAEEVEIEKGLDKDKSEEQISWFTKEWRGLNKEWNDHDLEYE